MEFNHQKTHRFAPEEIRQISGFFDTLQKIHNRLINEGYTIKDGVIYQPGYNEGNIMKTYEKKSE